MTKKLYEKDVYLKRCESTILDIMNRQVGKNQSSQQLAIILDQTIFFPTGGGQPCDLGSINGIPVIEVFEENGIIFHLIEDDSEYAGSCGPSLAQMLKIGQEVTLSIDWTRRFQNMQRHCGEHILSGIFFSEIGGVNRGFHMGNSYMTIDIDVPDISWEQAMKIEQKANQVVWDNAPVITRYFEKREDAEGLPLRKPLALEENISIVCVGSIANPADCVACCGTHPNTAGQVGLIKIIKLESYKGMTRIYFKAGEEAFLDYQKKHDIVTSLKNKYSAEEDLLEKIKKQDDKNKEIRQELYSIKKSLLSKYSEDIQNEYVLNSQAKKEDLPILIKEFDDLSIDDLLNLGRQTIPHIKGLLLLASARETTVLLFSDGKPDCGKLVKENAPIYNGKGGGNANQARAIFTKYEYVETFIDLLKKHLR